MITQVAVDDKENQFDGDTNFAYDISGMKVKSRTDARMSDTLKYWQTIAENDFLLQGRPMPDKILACKCPDHLYGLGKNRLWHKNFPLDRHAFYRLLKLLEEKGIAPESRELKLACYHIQAVMGKKRMEIQRPGHDYVQPSFDRAMPFDFGEDWPLIFETLARRFIAKQSYASIDKFLFEHDIISDSYKDLIRKGQATLEAIKYRRHFSNEARPIVQKMHKELLLQGFPRQSRPKG